MIMMNNKLKLNSDNKLPLNKTIEIASMITVVRGVFPKNNKYYPQVFLMNIDIYYEYYKNAIF